MTHMRRTCAFILSHLNFAVSMLLCLDGTDVMCFKYFAWDCEERTQLFAVAIYTW